MRQRLRAATLLIAGLLQQGCALLPPPEAPVTLSVLDQMPADLPRRPQVQRTLLVLAPEARPLFDSPQMAYTVQPHQVAYFARNQWAERPARMLQPLLVRTLEATGAFAVITPPYTGAPVLTLRTELIDLVQDFTQDPPVLRFGLRMQLSDAGQRILLTREMTLREAMVQRAPAAGVAAANQAMAKALRGLAVLVLEHAD
jgi:cholesterol transport system auxiliary component